MGNHNHFYGYTPPRKTYRLRNFLFDLLLVFITGGFWLIWIFVREMRK